MVLQVAKPYELAAYSVHPELTIISFFRHESTK